MKPAWLLRRNVIKKLIGNKAFYKMVLALALPLLLQNAVTTFINLLDNLMIGQVGTEEMSGVSIINQLLIIHMLCIFGSTSGAGIYAAQYYGRGDNDGVRYCLRFNILAATLMTALFVAVFYVFDEQLIRAFLHEGEGGGDLEATLHHAVGYLRLMLWGLLPFALTNGYANVLRVAGDTKLPMVASIVALLTNLVLNWVLIFGKLGFPVMGVRGAAIATVISRFVEAGLIMGLTHLKKRPPYAVGTYRSFYMPRELVKGNVTMSFPLLANELFWSLSSTVQMQCYSMRGLVAVAALNITNVVLNLFSVGLRTMGNCAGIIMGNKLGAGKFQEARDDCPRLIALCIAICAAFGAVLLLTADAIPHLYNTTAEVMVLAAGLMRIRALFLPVNAITDTSYFILRSGGKTYITVLFDSVFSWILYVPTAWLLVHMTNLPLLTVFAIVCAMELVKASVGLTLVRKGIWVQNIVETL